MLVVLESATKIKHRLPSHSHGAHASEFNIAAAQCEGHKPQAATVVAPCIHIAGLKEAPANLQEVPRRGPG